MPPESTIIRGGLTTSFWPLLHVKNFTPEDECLISTPPTKTQAERIFVAEVYMAAVRISSTFGRSSLLMHV